MNVYKTQRDKSIFLKFHSSKYSFTISSIAKATYRTRASKFLIFVVSFLRLNRSVSAVTMRTSQVRS